MQKELDIEAVIGFKGSVREGLILHPDNEHMVFALGSNIIVRDIINRQQSFLRGHDNEITVLAISPNGRYIASGQKTYMGFQADIIIWDFQEKAILHRLKLHKVSVESLSFSHNEKYLASVGGEDDKCTVIVWDVETGKALYGQPLGALNLVKQIRFLNHCDTQLLVLQTSQCQILSIDKANRKLLPCKVNLGNLKRVFTCLKIDNQDEYAYLGTKTGDVLEISIEKAIFKRVGPVGKLFSLGVECLDVLPNGDILVGAGSGAISKLSIQGMQIKAQGQVMGGVTSMTFTKDFTHFFAGTNQSNIYWVDTERLQPQLRNTCHSQKINDVCFPIGYSEVFATCGWNEIRIWNTKNRQELLRIEVPGVECNCVAFMRDGKSIISGWGDGKIRAFYPQSGKLMFVINDAHIHGVTAVSSTSDCQRIISGGSEGEVRVWQINKQVQVMKASLKEHRGRVWSIRVTSNDEQAVSASSDGSCIVWDIKLGIRLNCFQEKTLFKEVLYHPEESQILTTGSNRKITYWALFDGQAIRMLDGSDDGEVNALAITREGEHFVSGGEDKQLKLWGYDEGMQQYVGNGHAGSIVKLQFSPDQRFIISVGDEGAIFIWKTPQDVQQAKADNDLPTIPKEQ